MPVLKYQTFVKKLKETGSSNDDKKRKKNRKRFLTLKNSIREKQTLPQAILPSLLNSTAWLPFAFVAFIRIRKSSLSLLHFQVVQQGLPVSLGKYLAAWLKPTPKFLTKTDQPKPSQRLGTSPTYITLLMLQSLSNHCQCPTKRC